ncbi:mandelate racemase/muconate lactonizing enzyme family protein [Roseovarius nubinhibens]|uniref:mandelate racemase/muconate lactonizing enzyme family protein n=1 Tax=Roseovarius nubinhibens TaxID=314263 RepID=UPI001C0A05E5|nr:mandelate racemase/muconate lactonizing enzyme family protein [Roseovarius nubinhibens]MBU3000160.1 mandelate racemase/muconate lactonizing enzyme family protein [Roseovarius nubinhibens]
MKIAELSLYQHDLPVKDGPYTMSYGEISALDTTLVKLVTDTGIVGWGETCPLGPNYAEAHAEGARAALGAMARAWIGTEVLPLAAHRAMDGALLGHGYAKAAVDMAVYDALGKSLGLRVAELLGGAVTERVPSYYAIGIETPEEAGRIAAEKRAEGYPRLQLKVGGRAPEVDVATIRKVWEAIKGSGMRLAIDANRGWTTRDAIGVSQACADIPLVMEQPCASNDEMRALRGMLRHPLYMDETSFDVSTVVGAAGTGMVDGFGFKLTRLGGLQRMATARDICAARHLPHSCDDAWGGDVLAAACTHLGATVEPGLLEGVWIAAPYIDGHYDDAAGIEISGGHIALPAGPGLGVVPDEARFGTPVLVV